jgi:hypothetical protein
MVKYALLARDAANSTKTGTERFQKYKPRQLPLSVLGFHLSNSEKVWKKLYINSLHAGGLDLSSL